MPLRNIVSAGRNFCLASTNCLGGKLLGVLPSFSVLSEPFFDFDSGELAVFLPVGERVFESCSFLLGFLGQFRACLRADFLLQSWIEALDPSGRHGERMLGVWRKFGVSDLPVEQIECFDKLAAGELFAVRFGYPTGLKPNLPFPAARDLGNRLPAVGTFPGPMLTVRSFVDLT